MCLTLKKVKKSIKKEDNQIVPINERINEDVLSKLKSVSKDLKEEERKQKEELREKEKQKRAEKEKNKSFEELFNESSLDWKSFK